MTFRTHIYVARDGTKTQLAIEAPPRLKNDGNRLIRFQMYRELTGRLSGKSGNVLSVGGSDRLMDVLGMNPVTVTHANYPVHDMTNLNAFDSGAYDFVVSDMVLEHVEGNPFDAIDSCLRVLGSGGIAVHTTVFSYPIHNVPGDYWRFTPMALSLMHRSWSLVDVGAWGNFDAISAIHDDDQWSAVPGDSEHPRHILATDNDPNWPIVTWVIASK